MNSLSTKVNGREPGSRIGCRTATFAAAVLCVAGISVVTAGPASATTLQTTVLAPIDGPVTSSPDEPHHTPYDGDYSFDVAATGNVYARFRNTNGTLSLTVSAIARACASGSFADGGDRIRLNVLINGAKVGTVTYAHLTDFSYGAGAAVPVGARIARAVVRADGVNPSSCWSGSHVHVEPRNDFRYGCFFAGQLGGNVNGGSALGIVGGERATARNIACGAGAETGGGSIGEGSFVRTPDGAVFRIAGGAPIYVSTWDAFGGPQPYIDIDWGTYGALPAHPADNSFLVGAQSGRVFRIVGGGYRYYVSSWDPYGGPQPTTAVDDWALDNCDHMLCNPFGDVNAAQGGQGSVHVVGWAMDPDDTNPISVHVYADGTYIGVLGADQSRPDVDAVFRRGSNFGFDGSLPLGAGDHHVCVYGINVGVGQVNTELGCRDTTVSEAPANSDLTVTGPASISSSKRIRLRSLLHVNGYPSASELIVLERKANGTWLREANGYTDASGVIVFRPYVKKTMRFRVRYLGGDGPPAVAYIRVRMT